MSETIDKSARTFEITAKNFEEAKAQAEAEYSKEGEVSCYLLERESKGFLGIGAKPCRVRVTVTPKMDVVSEVLMGETKADTAPAREAKPQKQKEQREPKEQKPKEQPKKAPEVKENAPKAEKNDGAKNQKTPKSQKPQKAPKEQPPVEKSEKKEQKPKKERCERENLVITQAEMDIALDFINTLLRNMQSEAKAVQAEAPEGAVFAGVYPRIEIVGDKSGILIGHHGETMDAIQFLANLCLNRKTGIGGKEFVKIVVDIENYREKREETLRALARRMAAKAIKYKRNVVLEPMNPYERHIIHSEIQDIENVDTHSVGSDENRKVVITYEGEDKQEHRGRGGRGRNRSGRSDRSDRADKNSANVSDTAPKERPKPLTLIKVSEEESAAIKQAYEAYQEEKASKERPKRATSIDEILGSDDLF